MLVVCNGMMRAGSTLQYNLARSLVEKIGTGTGEGYFDNGQLAPPEGEFTLWAKDTRHHVIKMHDVHPEVARLTANDVVRICYIYRDIRDVAASAKYMWDYEGESLNWALDTAIATYYQLQTMEYVLWQRYEDVVSDLSAAVVTIADFLGLDAPQFIVAEIVEECSLDTAQRVMKEFSLVDRMHHFAEKRARRMPEPLRLLLRRTGVRYLFRKIVPYVNIYDERSLLIPGHVSTQAGAVGVWHTALEKQEIEAITERYKEWLIRAGYSV